jgi:hypothetical protein
MRDQISHPYKTTRKIIVLYTVTCKREKNRLWTEWRQALPEFNLTLFSGECNFDFLLSFSNVWTQPHFKGSFSSSACVLLRTSDLPQFSVCVWLTAGTRVFDFYERLLHARGSSHLTQRLIRPSVLSTHRSQDGFTLGRALTARDPELVDVALLTRLTTDRHARVHTCVNRAAVRQWHLLEQERKRREL